MASIDLQYLRKIGAIVRLQGKEYLSHPGLLRVAHDHGLNGIECDLVSWNATERAAVMRATATGERGTYTAYGDANPANVGRMIAGATLRMAETRAVNRALRLYTGLGMTTTEELPGDQRPEPKRQAPPMTSAPAAPTATVAQVRAAAYRAAPEHEMSDVDAYLDSVGIDKRSPEVRAVMVEGMRDAGRFLGALEAWMGGDQDAGNAPGRGQ